MSIDLTQKISVILAALDARVTTAENATAPLSSVIVQIGDSIGAGSETSGYTAFTRLGYPSNVTVNNQYSIGGRSLAQVSGDVPGGVYALYDPTKRCIVVIQRGTNDFGNEGRSATDAYALLTSLVGLYRSQGFYVVAATLLPRQAGTYPWTSDNQTQLTSYNTMVRSNTAGADYIMDLAADAVMGPQSAPADTTLYKDKLHPTNAGQDRLVTPYRATLSPIMQLAPRSVVSISASQSKPEGNSGATLYTFTATRTIVSGAINVPWGFSAGGTTAADFTGGVLPTPGTLAFADGEANKAITISVVGDTVNEADETFMVTLQAGTGYVVGTVKSASGTITNDDGTTTNNFIRFTTLNKVAETINGSGYDYKATQSGSFGGNNYARSPTQIPANANGRLRARLVAPTTVDGILLGLSVEATAAHFNTCRVSLFTSSFGDGNKNWCTIINGATAKSTLLAEVGDWYGIRRDGTTLYGEVSKDMGATWTVIATYTGSTTAALTPYMESASINPDGIVSLPELITS